MFMVSTFWPGVVRSVNIGRVKGRNEYHHGNLRAALLEVAEEEIARHGLEDFSLRAAARKVGVSATAAYRHFADREALVDELARQGYERMARTMEVALAEVAGRDARRLAVARFYAVGLGYVRFAQSEPQRFRLMFARRLATYPTRSPAQLLLETLDGLVTAGVVRPRDRAGAEVPVWAAVHGLATFIVNGLQPAPDDDALRERFDETARFILKALGVAPALAPPLSKASAARPGATAGHQRNEPPS
jgi:AcrR family transcriptional regulator